MEALYGCAQVIEMGVCMGMPTVWGPARDYDLGTATSVLLWCSFICSMQHHCKMDSIYMRSCVVWGVKARGTIRGGGVPTAGLQCWRMFCKQPEMCEVHSVSMCQCVKFKANIKQCRRNILPVLWRVFLLLG